MRSFSHYDIELSLPEITERLEKDGFCAESAAGKLYLCKKPKARLSFSLIPEYIADVKEKDGCTALDGSFDVKKSFYYICWAALAALLLPMFIAYDIASGVSFILAFQQFVGLLIALYLPVLYVIIMCRVRKDEQGEITAELARLAAKNKKAAKKRG